MSFAIDRTSYNKAAHYDAGHGYELRRGQPTSLVIHSTSNIRKDTAFAGEAKYLFDSALVSCHYLIGKDGAVVEFLAPAPWAAWHAGQALPAWINQHSIGIELHHSVGDPPYPKAQIGSLTWLVRDLTGSFVIAPAAIETHGQIALPGPYIRKHDPADFSHGDFLHWRAALATPPPAGAGTYRVTFGTAVYEAPRGDAPIALGRTAVLLPGEIIEIDGISSNGFAHMATGLGFAPLSTLERV